MADKDSKSSGQRSFSYHVDLNSWLRVLKWFHNKDVIVVSALSSVADSGTKQQWDDKKKKHCIVSYLEMVNWYNDSIGGINL